MFDAIKCIYKELPPLKLAGFCVARGSTKGKFCMMIKQNAVRQSVHVRLKVNEEWDFDSWLWDIAAKLM